MQSAQTATLVARIAIVFLFMALSPLEVLPSVAAHASTDGTATYI
jgi:hypothetical protein